MTIYHMNMVIVEVRDRTTHINKTNRLLSVFCSQLCCTWPATWHVPYYFSCLCIYPKRLFLLYSFRLQEFQCYPQFIMQLKTALCVNADIFVTILRNNALPLLSLGRLDIIIYQYDEKIALFTYITVPFKLLFIYLRY